MALALWARTAAGTNLAFAKGFSKALKSWKDVLQQTILRRVAQKPKVLDPSHSHARERCVLKPSFQVKSTERFHTRVFRSLMNTSGNQTSAAARRLVNELSAQRFGARSFRHVPLLSLIGMTLGMDVEELIDGNTEKVMTEMRSMFESYEWKMEPLGDTPKSLSDLDISHDSIANGCEGAVYKAKVKAHNEAQGNAAKDEDFDLAVKAVFNYGAESNAGHILRELQRETIPLNVEDSTTVVSSNHVGAKTRLPPHPNIVAMPGIFVDDVLVTEEGLKKFPAAMPRNLDPEKCYGRSKTLYLVMKRRTTHLGDYLSSPDHNVSMATRCLILAQVLEGVAHLGQHGIAHRDLKANNILVEVPKDGGPPKVEICDFGCCLAEENQSLMVSYPSRDLFIGGNSWLMAPEIATAQPGPGKVLDFSKADVWAVGALAYEILGTDNPFYPCKDNSRKQLSSATYCVADLPDLPAKVPLPVKNLIRALLTRDPKKRPSARVAATVVHLALLLDKGLVPGTKAPAKEQNAGSHPKPQVAQAIKERDMLQKVVVQALSTVCQLTFGSGQAKRTWDMETVARFLFLSRLDYQDFRAALRFF